MMANEKRLIDANALIEEMKECAITRQDLYCNGYAKTFIENAPTVDAEPVVHAYWIKEQDEHGIDRGWKCSNCRGSVYKMTYEPYKGCPHCRAKMDGGNEDG